MEQTERRNENSNNNNKNNKLIGNTEMDVSKIKLDNKKEKCKPMTKVVIRRLPPTMTQIQFLEQVSPIPERDYLYFVKADTSLGQNSFCRAYINFLEQQDIFVFREKFDNYVFVDSKGNEYPAVVEFAPFQRLPKKRIGRKKDTKCGTIESDPYYISFLETLKNQETDSANAQPKTEYSYQPFDNVHKRITTTPLLEYLKQRKAEKQRLKDEKREERRRRDLERRRIKDEPTISKVLKNPDSERDCGNKENKDERDKIFTSKDIKNRKRDDFKPSRDKMIGSRDRESKGVKNYKDIEKKHDREPKIGMKKYEDKKMHNKRDDDDDRKYDKGYYNKEERREYRKEQHKERMNEEKKGKSYEKMRQEKRRVVEVKKEVESIVLLKEEANSSSRAEKDKIDEVKSKSPDHCLTIETSISVSKSDDINAITDNLNKTSLNNSSQDIDDSKLDKNIEKPCKIHEILSNKLATDHEDDNTIKIMKSVKISKRRNSLESGADGAATENAHLRRHKSLDGGDEDNLQKNESDYKDKDKKDPRLERRIRNKDRPAMEIYRPGMGRFSKQRLEHEKSNHR